MGTRGLRPSQYNFMIIKYSEKFESIFYAVLCANITGYFLVAKSQPQGLFAEEEYIDIDKANWQQIINEHNRKFGEIKWFNNNSQFFSFKENINLALRFWQPFKYKAIIEIIKISLKYGLDYLESADFAEIKYWHNIIKLVGNEVVLGTGYVNLMPANRNQEKFLLGEYNEESRVGDLILKNLQQKYFGYNFLLRTPKFVYLLYKDKFWIWDTKVLNSEINLAKLLEVICQKQIDTKPNTDISKNFGLDFFPSQNLAFG